MQSRSATCNATTEVSTRAILRDCRDLVVEFFWLAILLSLCIVASASAQTYGALDTSWGSGVGYVKTPILSPTSLSSRDNGRAISVQLDGKVVVAGVCYNATPPASYSVCVARYNANGSLDANFNTTGTVTAPLPSADTSYQKTAIALTPYGQITVITGCAPQFCVFRFTKSGALDTGFGNNGVVTTALTTTNNYPSSVAYQSDGRFVLGGLCGNRICAIRYFENGTLDPSFAKVDPNDNDGLLLNGATGTFNRETYTMMVDANDRILLGGSCFINSQTVFCLTRFTSDGLVDSSFAGGGVAEIPVLPGSGDYAYAMTSQSDGKLLLTGQAFGSVANFATVRYNTDGTLDTGFGTGGFVVTNIADSYSEARAVVEQADGKIVVAGYCYDTPPAPAGRRFCLVAYSANGTLDTNFNGVGFSKLLLGPQNSFAIDQAYAMAIGRDGKLYAAGECRNTSQTGRYDFCVARYFGSTGGGLRCVVDLSDGNNILATQDSLALARLTTPGVWNSNPNAVIFAFNSVIFSPQQIWGPFKRWTQGSFDYDGDGAETSTDAIIHTRSALGFTGNSVTNGLSFSPNANRNTWAALRNHFVNRCGWALP
jgi:uncharacterized delta-60 repeat protein